MLARRAGAPLFLDFLVCDFLSVIPNPGIGFSTFFTVFIEVWFVIGLFTLNGTCLIVTQKNTDWKGGKIPPDG